MNWLFQQFQLKPGKPAIASSLRALVSVLAPLGVGVWLGQPVGSVLAVLGAWFVGLVNVEGVYRQQATAKIAALISITAMLLLANLVHGTLWLSALMMFLVMFVAGFVGLFGQAASAIGLTTSITFIVALARFATFPDWSTVLQQCALCLAGGLWSIGLSLSIWQLHPYKPVIQSVANCYEALSQLVNSATGRVAHLDDRRNQLSQFLQAQDNFTQALTTARDRWGAAWTAQQSANSSANQLLILVEDTPAIATSIVALVEQVVITSDHALFQRSQREIQQAMEQVASALQQISKAIANGRSFVHLGELDRAIEALNHQQQTLPTQLNQRQSEDYTALTSLSKIRDTLVRLADQVHADAELITTLQRGDTSTTAELITRKATLPKSVPPTRSIVASILEPLRNNLTVHSVLFRHALRLAIVATIAEILASILQIPRGYWITLTAVVALKPNYGGTSQTTIQRVIGTILGGVIGIAIVTLIHNAWVIGGCLLLLIMTAMAVRSLSFSLFITLLTPAIILLLNVTSQSGWQIGVLRIADSLAGGFLALLGSYLLFPRWERQQLPTQLETTIRANLAYFQQVIAIYLHPGERVSTDGVAPLRRQAALENTNMTAAAQRLFIEPRHVQGEVEPVTTLIFYVRRFFNSVTALAEHRQELSQAYQCDEFKQFADAIVQVLENVVDTLQQGALQPLPDLDRHLKAIHNHIEQLHRDAKQFSLEENRTLNTADLDTLTYTSRTLRESTPVSANLEQIAYEIRNIHSAIARFSPGAPSRNTASFDREQ
jgi:uncharacterized membrane protein YccC